MATKLTNLAFPLAGLKRSTALQSQPPYTTGACSNVRPRTTRDNRVRGGQRPGLSRAFSVQPSAIVTITVATPGVVTWSAHGLSSGQIVSFTTTGALPAGLASGREYYVTVLSSSTFKLSDSLVNYTAGIYVATSGSQSGVHTGFQKNAVRMMAELDYLHTGVDGYYFESFDGRGFTAHDDDWTNPGNVATVPATQNGMAYATYSQGLTGLVRAIPTDMDATSQYSIDCFCVPYQGDFGGDYYIWIGLNNLAPDVLKDCVEIKFSANTGQSWTASATWYNHAGGVVGGVNALGNTAFKPGLLSILHVPGSLLLKVYWQGAEIISTTVAFGSGAGTTFGFGMQSDDAALRTQVDHIRLQYSKTAAVTESRTTLVASSNGVLYQEAALGAMPAVSTTTTLASDRNLMASQRLQKLYIADCSAVRRTGTGNLLAVSTTVTNKALTTNVVTLTVSGLASGLATGDIIDVNLNPPDATFDGRYTVASTPTATTFTYAKTNGDIASTAAGGSVKAFGVRLTDTPNDWTIYGIDVTADVVTIAATDPTDTTVVPGNYPIRTADTSGVYLAPSGGLSANGAEVTYSIVRGAKIYDPVAATLTRWQTENGTPRAVTITNRVLTDNLVTITTATAHLFAVGDDVIIALSAADALLDGRYTIVSVPTTTTFTYNKAHVSITALAAPAVITQRDLTTNLVTITTRDNHNFSTGFVVTIALSPADAIFDGAQTITVIGAKTFTYPITHVDVATAHYKGTATPVAGTATTVPTAKGTVPAGCPIVATYRDRLVLAGADQQWYLSRQSNPLDFDFGADPADAQRAVAGTLSTAGTLGKTITAVIPYQDDYLIMACKDQLWMMRGDPAFGGQLDALSRTVGIIDKNAWCWTPAGQLLFISLDGLYIVNPGHTVPESLSRENLPRELLNIDTTKRQVTMAYDTEARGIHIYLSAGSYTPTYHWWIDIETKSFWPVELSSNFEPFAVIRYNGRDFFDSGVLLGSRTGVIYKYRDVAELDESTQISGYVTIGPMRIGSNDRNDGILAELIGTLATDSGPVDWILYQGSSCQAAFDASTLSTSSSGSFATGSWTAGRNYTAHPRMRGGAMLLKIRQGSSTRSWAFESATAIRQDAGRQRLP